MAATDGHCPPRGRPSQRKAQAGPKGADSKLSSCCPPARPPPACDAGPGPAGSCRGWQLESQNSEPLGQLQGSLLIPPPAARENLKITNQSCPQQPRLLQKRGSLLPGQHQARLTGRRRSLLPAAPATPAPAPPALTQSAGGGPGSALGPEPHPRPRSLAKRRLGKAGAPGASCSSPLRGCPKLAAPKPPGAALRGPDKTPQARPVPRLAIFTLFLRAVFPVSLPGLARASLPVGRLSPSPKEGPKALRQPTAERSPPRRPRPRAGPRPCLRPRPAGARSRGTT